MIPYDRIDVQVIEGIQDWNGRVARVTTVDGSRMNVPRNYIPEEAYQIPGDFYLVFSFKSGKHPNLRVVPILGYDPEKVFDE